MTEKEIAELKRRFTMDKTGISRVRGCYVSAKKEITSEFNQFFGTIEKEEAEKLLAILKKTLSGTHKKNLVDIEFSNQQVMDSEEHKLLMDLRESELQDDELAMTLYKKIIDSVDIEENYIILLTLDKYDIPVFGKDDFQLEDSSEIFSYLVCCVCPVKVRKSALSYCLRENEFHNISADLIISNPELGFTFPAFDERQTNIYNALYYTKNTAAYNEDFIQNIFNTEIPLPADIQKDTFNMLIEETISEECDMEVMQSVHAELSNIIAEHKASKVEEPLSISKNTVKSVLSSCGVDNEHIEAFDERYNEEFGERTELIPKNIIDTKKFEVKTADVTIKVNPEKSSLVQTRIIDGIKYIVIKADDSIEVNGVNINIPFDSEEESDDSTSQE